MAGSHVKFMNALEERVKANGTKGHIIGDKLTLPDMVFLHFYTAVFCGSKFGDMFGKEESVAKYPVLKEYFEHLKEDFKDYLASRPVCSM